MQQRRTQGIAAEGTVELATREAELAKIVA
eukprot:SAG11_NODE_31119_length_294_cov_1.820513_1_plen_29_part_01